MAGLRLDMREGAFADRGGHPAIVPGNSAGSRLYQKITEPDKSKRMPPPISGATLSSAEIDLIRQWIDQGAKWERHWAYGPPVRPPLPSVKHRGWARNPIDAFILARLEREGLEPSPEADKATLLRRLSLDLTGLAPTPDELRAFLADRSPDAYEKQVDRLLASPRYGERMAMHWLDIARYADTHGYHIDSHRDMWPWRDWVIRAFNANMRFDEFTLEQLAGDLLPHPTLDQKIATGFNRNHMINFEGGAIPEEYQNEYVVDRVETTSVAWLGSTLGCARCHDHKYDPFKQKEFYRFYAFFNTISEKGLDGRKGNAEPYVQIPSPVQKLQLEEITGELAAKQKAWSEKEIAGLEAGWEKTRLETLPQAPREGLLAHYELDGSLSDSSGHYRQGRILAGDLTFPAGPVGKAADFDGETRVQFPAPPNASSDAFSLAVWARPTGRKEMDLLHCTDGARRGYELAFDESQPVPVLKRGAHLLVRLIHQWPGNAIQIQTKERLILGNWYHLALDYDGSGKSSGLHLYIDGKPAETVVIEEQLAGPIRDSALVESRGYKGQMDDLRFYSRALAPADIEELAQDEPTRASLMILPKKRSQDQKERLREFFLTQDAPAPIRKLHADIKTLQAQKEHLDDIIPTSMVMAEMQKPRETFVLARGDYRNKGEKVTPGVPAALPPFPKDAPLNRLGLAKWLLDPQHPLTARVAVNRYWQMYFGTGIVKTAQDFGSQGDPPSHPELLDWLATEFIRTGWDVKAMQRLIVTSTTYRQSSKATPELHERDPENRLLARGPRFRLPAEMIRDNALYVSGLLNEQIGGRSVFPYQPKGLWEDIAYGDVYSAQTYTPSHGKDLYRRSMYTFWKRTSPPPAMITFDAPDREKCTAQRTLTNTPLQALVLMNDPTFVEAARVLAQRVLHEAGRDAHKRIALAFRLAAGRSPQAREVRVLRDLERRQIEQYRRQPDQARKLLEVGESNYDEKLDAAEVAAWTTVTSTILNLDETITKE